MIMIFNRLFFSCSIQIYSWYTCMSIFQLSKFWFCLFSTFYHVNINITNCGKIFFSKTTSNWKLLLKYIVITLRWEKKNKLINSLLDIILGRNHESQDLIHCSCRTWLWISEEISRANSRISLFLSFSSSCKTCLGSCNIWWCFIRINY